MFPSEKDKDYFFEVLEKYQQGKASAGEREFVEQYLEILQYRPSEVLQNFAEDKDNIRLEIFNKLKESIEQEKVVEIKTGRKTISLRRYWWAAAAVVLFVVGGLWFVVERGRKLQGTGDKIEVAKTNDVEAPKDTRAVITLADGRKVYLDSAGNGTIAQENNVNVVRNENGEVVYQTVNASTPLSMTYNTLFNPRGSKVISLTLSDGTKVWLNSESSLRYPASFAPSAVSRDVEITGEAYFEVAHDKAKPFVVSKGDMNVQVLGTHFNVNAYNDEQEIKVTLLEGSVKVNSNGISKLIRPGQQARVNGNINVREVNTDEVMSWKEGIFLLDNTDVPTIMRQVSRWYDVNVVYEGKVPATRFGGGVSKDQPLSVILETLERYGLQFEFDGKTIRVM